MHHLLIASLSLFWQAAFESLLDVLDLDSDGHLVEVLIDLTFYEHKELASQAFGLLVRQFEQRKVLADAGRRVQLLVRPKMVQMYRTFDDLLRQLNRLAARRRLFDAELYRATRLMGELTMHCYEEAAEEGAGGKSAAGGSRAGSRAGRSAAGRSGQSGSRAAGKSAVDHTAGIYLALVGRARVAIGRSTVEFTTLEGSPPRMVRPGESLQIEGAMYHVKWASSDSGYAAELDRPLKRSDGQPLHPNLQPGGSGEVWVMLESKTPGPNPDMQMLLCNLGAHKAALQLLKLPFTHGEVLAADLQVRAVLRAAYRLLKAMCSGFSLMQSELAAHLDLFVSHTEADLVSHDISPTGCINAVCQYNRNACMKMSAETINHFARLAGEDLAPRYLRFLRMITAPQGKAIKRNQDLVVTALAQCEEALLLYSGPADAERAQLILDNDHLTNPRGKLVYHMELIGLLASIVAGKNQVAEAIVRDVMPLDELVQQQVESGLCRPRRERPVSRPGFSRGSEPATATPSRDPAARTPKCPHGR